MNLVLKMIISGGQTGIDELALRIANQYGVKTGGWMPPMFLTEEGCKPEFEEKYNMQALGSGLWSKRTRYNVKCSDGTVVFGNVNSGGTASTINFLAKFKKPYCINPEASDLIKFVLSNQIQVLNVAGNKGSILSPWHHDLATRSLTALCTKLCLGVVEN